MTAKKLEHQHRISIDNLSIDNITISVCVEKIVRGATNGEGGWVVTPNADISRQAYRDLAVSQLIAQADMVVADGMPLVWASRIQGTPLRERVCGSDLVWAVADACVNKGLSIFLIGGGLPDTASRAADALRLRYPTLKIVGAHYPPFGFESRPEEIQKIEARLRATMPNIVYVALGFPRAERLIARLKPDYPYVWWLGVGISLSFICGDVKRAPPWMQRFGLEWVHRLAQEPRRLTKRYLWDDVPYVVGLLARVVSARIRRVIANNRA